jgi:hypothetical protein
VQQYDSVRCLQSDRQASPASLRRKNQHQLKVIRAKCPHKAD